MAKTLTPQQLADAEACREAARRYARGVDRLDAECMKSAYWPEATDDHGVFAGNAWEFVERCMSSHRRFASTMHSIYTHSVELDDDGVHGRGELYNVTHLFRADEPIMDTWFGRYLDEYEKRGDEWRIIHRVCVHEADRSVPLGSGMPLDSAKFRQGSFDRPDPGRPIGP